jgi:hypothetical protein
MLKSDWRVFKKEKEKINHIGEIKRETVEKVRRASEFMLRFKPFTLQRGSGESDGDNSHNRVIFLFFFQALFLSLNGVKRLFCNGTQTTHF